MASFSSAQLPEALESLKLEDGTKRIHSVERHRGVPDSRDEVMEDSVQPMDMDASIWTRMPEELLEKILARLPFKSLFQTRLLSKSWEEKLRSTSFQAEVSQFSSTWDSYCPVYIGNEGLIGYNSGSKRCERALTLSYLPYRKAALIPNSRGKFSGCGSLLCFVDLNQFPSIYVTNVITNAWKVLPPRPNMNYPALIHLFLTGSNAYKVLLITPLATPCAQIYDSTSNSWSIRFSESAPEASNQLPPANRISADNAWISANNAWTDSIYFQNTLYVLWGYQYDGPRELLAYKGDEGSWSNIRIGVLRPSLQQADQPEMVYFIHMSRILVCGGRVMIVVLLTITSSGLERIRSLSGTKNLLVVFQLFPDSQQILEVSRGPPLGLVDTDLNEAACDDKCIYFYQRLAAKSTVVVYDTRQQEWSCLPPVFNTPIFLNALKKKTAPEYFLQPANFSFQPGLNTFMAV